MLGGSRRLFMYNSLLINCYVGTTEDKNCIVLVYKDSNTLLFSKFERALIRLKSFIKDYDLEDGIIFIFNVPPYHKRDYKRFI